MVGALEGTTAIEVSGHVAGPYAGSLLGDLGCEVIKVELPGEGDTHQGRIYCFLSSDHRSGTIAGLIIAWTMVRSGIGALVGR